MSTLSTGRPAPRRLRGAVVAHRGGAQEAAENTWSAVEHTHNLGLEWMETDLRVSADGVVILSHDPVLWRTAGVNALVSSTTWAELSQMDAGDGRPPVRFDELLGSYPQLRLNVDVKDSAVAQPALEVVRAADALDRVRFASFSARRLAGLRRAEPRATTSLGVTDVIRLVLQAQSAVAVRRARRSWRGQVDAVQVPTVWRGLPLVTERFVATAHHMGLEVHVWTVDDPQEMRRLADLNVDAIVTDVPSQALEVLGALRTEAGVTR